MLQMSMVNAPASLTIQLFNMFRGLVKAAPSNKGLQLVLGLMAAMRQGMEPAMLKRMRADLGEPGQPGRLAHVEGTLRQVVPMGEVR